jgi:hypothetical protein
MFFTLMGLIGEKIGNFIGSKLGGLAGGAFGGFTGTGSEEGGRIGGILGGNLLGKLIPFKKGGRVKKTGPILAHKGEFVLPAGVKPTKQQLHKVMKKRSKKSKKGCSCH